MNVQSLEEMRLAGPGPSGNGPSAKSAPLSRDAVLRLAAEIADHDGLEALSCARLAAGLRAKPRSLQRHFHHVDAIRDALGAAALADLIALYEDAIAGLVGREALDALAHAQRTYAQARPGQYVAAMQALRGHGPAIPRLRQAYLTVVRAMLEGYNIHSSATEDTARGVIAALQGFIMIELEGGIGSPVQIDLSYQRLVDMLDAGAKAAAKASVRLRRTFRRTNAAGPSEPRQPAPLEEVPHGRDLSSVGRRSKRIAQKELA
jgi:AcrR family transcriptional regulator